MAWITISDGGIRVVEIVLTTQIFGKPMTLTVVFKNIHGRHETYIWSSDMEDGY